MKSACFWARYNTNGSINVGHCCFINVTSIISRDRSLFVCIYYSTSPAKMNEKNYQSLCLPKYIVNLKD